MRIVSLLPSATEMVCALGLKESLVGISHECNFPASIDHLPRVTRSLLPADVPSDVIDAAVRERAATLSSLYDLEQSLLESLAPDLIITQSLCNVCAVAEDEIQRAVGSIKPAPVILDLRPGRLDDVLSGIWQVAKATGTTDQAAELVKSLQNRIDQLARRSQSIQRAPTVMLMEWTDPPFAAGHWNPELVQLAGGRELFGKPGERSTTISWQQIIQASPEVICVSCCGMNVDQTIEQVRLLGRLPAWQQLRSAGQLQVFVVDGSAYFSRPGPRLVDSAEILAHALHPQIHPLPPGLPTAIRFDAVPT